MQDGLAPPLRVGEWLVDPDLLRISSSAGQRHLEPRIMQLLVYLAERPNRVISAEQLLTEVWCRPFSGDGPVQRAVAILRRTLGDHPARPEYLETIRKRGYRLIANVVLPDNYRAHLRQSDERWNQGSPFVGLTAFDAAHSGVFFGRSKGTAELLNAISRQWRLGNRLVLLLGPSGCGKTSLIRAGAIPLIARRQGFDGIRAVALSELDFAATVSSPLVQLANALGAWEIERRPIFPQRAWLTERLGHEREEIHAALRSAFQIGYGDGTACQGFALLQIDHCEALLTQSSADLARLNQALMDLCSCPQVLLLMVCRSDFYPELLAKLPAVATLKTPDGHYDLLPPTAGELAEIIRRPVLAAGLRFEQDGDSQLGLDDALRDAAISHPESLPMLQFTLQALYEARTDNHVLSFRAYAELGGLEGALAKHAEQAYQALPPELQQAFSPVLERVVVSYDASTTLTARSVLLAQLRSSTEHALVKHMVEARLFTSSLVHGVPQFSLTHETLLRAWPRVQDWARDNQRSLQTQLRVKRATALWLRAQNNSDLLLNQGLPLAEAEQLLAQFPRLLDADDRLFVRASRRARRRRQRMQLLVTVGALAMAALSVVLALAATHADDRAQLRRAEAEQLVEYMLTDLADQLRPLGRLALMDQVAQRALNQLAALPDSAADWETQLQRSRALRTLGEVFIDRGDDVAARRALTQARHLIGASAEQSESALSLLAESGTVAYWLGYLDFRQGHIDAAQGHFERYRDVARALIKRQPDQPGWTLELSYALNNIGSLAHYRGDSVEAVRLFERSAQLKDEVLAVQPDNTVLAVEQADSLSWIGSALEQQGRLREAQSYYARQLQLLQAVGQKDPGADSWRHRLALAQLISGNLKRVLKQPAIAAVLYAQAEKVLLELVDADPSNTTWRRNLSYAQAQIARLLLEAQPERSLKLLARAQQGLQPLLNDLTAPPEWHQLAVTIDLRRAIAQQHLGYQEQAQLVLSQALAGSRALLRQDPDRLESQKLLGRVLIIVGDLAARTGTLHLDPTANSAWLEAREVLATHAAGSRDRGDLMPWMAVNERLQRSGEVQRARRVLIDSGLDLGDPWMP